MLDFSLHQALAVLWGGLKRAMPLAVLSMCDPTHTLSVCCLSACDVVSSSATSLSDDSCVLFFAPFLHTRNAACQSVLFSPYVGYRTCPACTSSLHCLVRWNIFTKLSTFWILFQDSRFKSQTPTTAK